MWKLGNANCDASLHFLMTCRLMFWLTWNRMHNITRRFNSHYVGSWNITVGRSNCYAWRLKFRQSSQTSHCYIVKAHVAEYCYVGCRNSYSRMEQDHDWIQTVADHMQQTSKTGIICMLEQYSIVVHIVVHLPQLN